MANVPSTPTKTGHDIGQVLEDVMAQLKRAAEGVHVGDSLSDAAKTLTTAAEALAGQAREHSKAIAKTAVKEAKEHPAAAAAIAVGAAALVALLVAGYQKTKQNGE